jgi:uncharacterized surface protein with fasciclin (FAS1) repeats
MKMIEKLSKLFLATVLGTSFIATTSSCSKDDPAPAADNTITGKVSADPSLSLLKTAVVRANLATTLQGTGPFTVFAPADAAFNAVGLTSAAINATDPAVLAKVLLYHTLPGSILAANVPAGPNAKVLTANSPADSVFVTRNANGVFINGIKVTTADISASNGVIHKIGAVLQPAIGNIVVTAQGSGLDSLVKAVLRATNAPGGDPSLAGTLSSAKLTVFAPTNQAFTNLLTALGLSDINNIPVATLLAVLRYHVVGGRAFSSDLSNGSLAMLAGGSTTVNLTNGTGGGPTIKGNGNGANASNITATNIVCTNGVVHLIDRVLLP